MPEEASALVCLFAWAADGGSGDEILAQGELLKVLTAPLRIKAENDGF